MCSTRYVDDMEKASTLKAFEGKMQKEDASESTDCFESENKALSSF